MDDNENKKHFGPGFLGAFATDQRFHDYILRDFCGCGAYGEVWQAEDISGRRLAIKIVSKKIYGSGWTREFNGIKNYCRLISSHPNLIQIMHVGEDDQYFFYTMELADNLAEPGRAYYADTLADRLAANGPFASDQLVILTQHLLNGIGALHQAGLIHRDIKPANIIFINGVPKLSDIGFVAPRDASISLAGTVGFIPPEELLSENESSAEKNCQYDIYALGKVMYCALTGLPPDEYPALPESISFGLSKRLNQVICMACCKNPADRIASIDEFRQLLTAAANGEEKLERQKNSKPSADLPQTPAAKKMAAAAIILIVIIILGGMFMLGGFLMLKDQIPKNINITVSGDKSASPATITNTAVPSTAKPANAVVVQTPAKQAVTGRDAIPGSEPQKTPAAQSAVKPASAVPIQPQPGQAAASEDAIPGSEPQKTPAAAPQTSVVQPAKNSNWTVPELNMQMVYVEPGKFIMGEGNRRDRVTISRHFWIGKYEVTQQEYEQLTGSNPSLHNGKRLPVECVSWNEASAFCDKLSESERRAGRLPEGYVYRLPTSAEWEYAARGGNKSKGYEYSGGNDIDSVAWHKNNAGETTHEVGTKLPNELGLYDMSGNVWELCLNWYGNYHTQDSVDPVNLVPGKARVVCGGGYTDGRRPAYRGSSAPERKNQEFGFRIVLAASIHGVTPSTPMENKTIGASSPKPATAKIASTISQPEQNSNWTVPELDMQMVFVESGTYMMGNNNRFGKVIISRNFWIGRYEVTQQEYQKIMGGNPSVIKENRLPVVYASWNEASTFCDKLTAHERIAGRLPDGYVYRLPTAAEWEYAARGGNKGKGYEYSGSNDIDAVSWNVKNSGVKTHEVGTKQPNELGIYDMSGNAWEFSQDWWQSNYSPSDSVDPVNLVTGEFKILCGGGCINESVVGYRAASAIGRRGAAVGFRIVLAASIATSASAAPATQVQTAQQPSVNSNWTVPELNMQMMPVEPGTFMMGTADGFQNEKPVHKVTITRNYWIGKYEVTQQEYQNIMSNNPSGNIGDRLPAECITRNEAMDFCKKLTEKENRAERLPSGYMYRLPTEAEWEYAALGGNKSKNYIYSGGNDIDVVAWYDKNSNKKSHEIGTKQPNELGIHDMSGNVWEWCWDLYDSYSGADATDPSGPAFGTKYIQKGGCYESGLVSNCRVQTRNNFLPHSRRVITGFRVALAPVLSGTPATQTTAAAQPAKMAAGPVTEKNWSVPELGMELLYIRPGGFMMGSTRAEQEWATGPEGKAQKLKYENDEPEENTIQDAFWLGRTKVTVGQWRKFIDAAEYRSDAEKRGVAYCFDWQKHGKWMWMPEKNWRDPNYSYPVQDNFPVTCVSWNDAAAFCKWLTESEHQSGRLPPELEYRLPTETEWEYACRGGKAETRFWWGNDWGDAAGRLNAAGSDKFPNGKLFRTNHGKEDCWAFASPVDFYGEKGRNGFGLADMLGNTWEWCLDDSIENSKGTKILRGGAFDAPPGNLRCASRIGDNNSEPCAKYGFRIVCAVVKEPAESVNTANNSTGVASQFQIWFYNGHYYRLFNECVSWDAAKKRCEEMGGGLVSIETPGENSFLYENIKNVNGVIFTGAVYEPISGLWRWTGSDKRMKFFRWDTGQPAGNKYYAAFSPLSRKDRWGSYDGTAQNNRPPDENTFGFICEWENAGDASKSMSTIQKVAAAEPAAQAVPAAQTAQTSVAPLVKTASNDLFTYSELQKKFKARYEQDRKRYSEPELREIERLYLILIKRFDSSESLESFQKIIDKYPLSNRAGCAMLFMGLRNSQPQAEDYLRRAILNHSDCWYDFKKSSEGIVPVGAFARFYLAGYYRKSGKTEEAEKLFQEIREKYPENASRLAPSSTPSASGVPAASAAQTQTAQPSIAQPSAAPPSAKTASDDLFMRAERRKQFMARLDQDRKRYSEAEMREIEELYQIANRKFNSAEAQESLKKLISKYSCANRTGCAVLYLGQMCPDRPQAEEYLRQAIANYSDCWYGDGVQVGAYARFYLAGYYRQSGKNQEAEKLYQEIREKYPDAVTHNGKPLANEFPK